MKVRSGALWLAALLGCSSSGSERMWSDAAVAADAAFAGGNGEAQGGFKPGDCSHPDWPGQRICCGRADEQQGVNCLPPALVDRPCSMEGEHQDVKVYKRCCRGLTAIRTARLDDAGAACVEPFELDPTRVCTRCGDGTCGAGENRCNCAHDCASDGGAP